MDRGVKKAGEKGWVEVRRMDDGCEGGAKRPLVAGEITFCNSTVRRRILIPAINLERIRAPRTTDPFGSRASILSAVAPAAAAGVER